MRDYDTYIYYCRINAIMLLWIMMNTEFDANLL